MAKAADKIPELSSHIAALSSEDAQAQANSLNVLLAADVRAYPQDEQGALNMAGKVAALLAASGNPPVRMAAARLAARLAQQFGAMQRALKSDAFLTALWSVVSDFGTNFEAYREVLQQVLQAAAQPEPGKKTPAAKAAQAAPPVPVDFDGQLPVPHKHCLDGALRCLTSLAALSSTPAAWLCLNAKPELLLPLLQHHSPRIQLRALLCIRALATTSGELCSRLMVRDLVPNLLKLVAASGSGTVMVAAAQALLHVCQQGPGAAVVQLVEQGAVHPLLQLVIAPEVLPVPPQPPAAVVDRDTGVQEAAAAGTSSGAEAQLPKPVDYAKLPACRPQDLQQAAAALLVHLASFSLEASRQLLEAGAPNLVLALLPSVKSKQQFANPAPSTPTSVTPAAKQAQDLANLTPPPEPPVAFFPLPPAADTAAQEEGLAAESGSAAVPLRAAEPSILHRAAFPLPRCEAPIPHALQASLLQLLSLLLSNPDVQEAVWQAVAASPLVPFLTYYLTAPSAADLADAALTLEAPKGRGKDAKSAKPASAKGMSKAAAAAAAAAAEAAAAVSVDAALPPFPSFVKVAAVRCLTQLAKHPELAAAVRSEEAVRTLFASAALAAPGASTVNEPVQMVQVASIPEDAPVPVSASAGTVLLTPAAAEAPDAPLAEATAALLQLLMQSSDAAPVVGSHQELMACIKGLAAVTHARGSPVACSTAVRTVLLLPGSDLIASPQPPPPSPPYTPPPLPLATSQFVWDALGRPNMTDGSNVKLVHL